MSWCLVDLFRSSGDAHVGQTLVRLAELAELLHVQQQAEALRGAGCQIAQPPGGSGEVSNQAVVQDDRRLASVGMVRCHKEVDR